tara:strand:- start:231 stop:851 length:621 start_codon:yes stop_codon:yes gene_type:complete
MGRLTNKVATPTMLNQLTSLGVYKIYHVAKADVFYIGSASANRDVKACQKGFYRRFLEHLHYLEHNKHSSKYLQNVVNKYGIEGLRFEIIEVVNSTDRTHILEREQYYLDLLKPGYNSSKVAKCPTVVYTEERKDAARQRRKGIPFVESAYQKIRKSIRQYDKNGALIKEYSSIQMASDETSINRATISKCASGTRKSAGGYLWKF